MIVTAVLAAQVAGTFDYGDTTQFSARAAQPAPETYVPFHGKVILAADATTSATAGVRLRQREWDYSLSLVGSLSTTDLEEQVKPLATGGARLTEGWHDRLLRVSLSESIWGGLVSAAVPYQPTAAANTNTMMMAQPGMTGQPTMMGQGQQGGTQGQPATPGAFALLGQQTTVETGSFDVNGNVSWRSSRTTGLSVQGGYTQAGGLDVQSRFILPETFVPHASVAAVTMLSRTDGLSLTLSGQDTITVGFCTLFASNAANGQCREEVPNGELDAAVRHKFSRTGTFTVGVGVGATVAATQGLNELVIVPTATASIGESLEERRATAYTLSATLSPTVDLRTGLPSTRISLSGVVSDRLTRTATLNVSGGLIQSLPFPTEDPYPITAFSSSVEVRYRLERRASVGFGVQAYLQHQSLTGPDQGAIGPEWSASEIAYVSVTAGGPPLHF
jgi:hypothetical protein